jgi:protein involved in polysaccharide export with SLBB domain
MGITEVENTMMRKYNARAVYLLGILLFMMIGVVPPLHAFNTDEHLLPGNLLTFSLMGNEAISKDFRIDPHGFIQLPDIGPINCKGLTLQTLKAIAIKQLSSSYKNADSLGVSKKSNQFYVNVLGLVAKPGTYLVGPHDGLQIALERAGGMLDGAQMNQLQLHREAKVIIIDYKQYLNTGNFSMLPSLMAMDEIFVPSSKLIGNVKLNNQQLLPQQGDAANFKDSIKIFGAVFKPGAYTYNPNFSAIDYLLKAGGTTLYAKTDQIKIIDNATAVAFNLREYLTTAQKALLPKISLGATIFVPQTSEVAKPGTGTVYVMGQVQHPGSFELGKKTSFMGAVGNAGGPNQYAETRKIRIIHANGKVDYFDMQAFTEGLGHVKLPELIGGDVIYFPLKTDLNEKSWLDIAPKRSIKIIGAVTRPGRYEWADEMNIMDLISNVGGPTKDADTAHIRIISTDSQTPPIEFNLKSVIEKGIGKEGLPKLKAGYTVSVPEIARAPINLKQAIKLFGEVYKPGAYAYNPKLTAVDYILLAGGITHYANPDQIRIIDNTQSTSFNLKEYLDTATSKNMPVIREGATIFVPVVTNDVKSDSRTVYVIGQVQKPDA